jgi:flagellar assembly protein FliH
MKMELDWKELERLAAWERLSPPRIEKLSYRAPGTLSVPARPLDEAVEEAEAALLPAIDHAALVADLEERLRKAEALAAAEASRLISQGREQAESARIQAEQYAKASIEQAVREIGAALDSFRREREEYFTRVEREVVELALAIATRILHREVTLDPMLLAGAVRVALDQLSKTTHVRLRCPQTETEHWRELTASLPLPPEVVGEAAMGPGECVIEAQMGVVDLGIKAQLAEVERGFFDLLDK